MFGMGIGEFVLILLVVLVVFGPGKLPEVGEALGKAIREFQGALKAPPEIESSSTQQAEKDTKEPDKS